MAEVLTCPSCQRRLRLPANVQAAWYTCPACLAKFQNPATQITTAPVVDIIASRAGAGPSTRVSDRKEAASYLVEDEVEQDTKRAGGCMILLAALGAIAIGCSLLIGGRDISFLIKTILGIFFLGLISTGIMFWRTGENPEARGFGRVVVGTLQLAGVLIAIPLILAVALLIFLFAVCLIGGMPPLRTN